MVPNGWKKESLSDVTTVIDCKHRTPIYVEAGIPLVSPGTIKWGALDLVSPVKRVSKDEYESLMDHCTIDTGDLVMSRNQSVGIASYVETDEPFVLGQDTVLIKPKKVDSKFVFYKLQSEVVQRSIIKLAGGSTFSRINLADIRKLKLNFPPLPEQKKIAQILSTWDKAITTTEQLLSNSQQQKKALMQQLLTGKKRLLDKNGVRFSGEWIHGRLGDLCAFKGGSAFKEVYQGQSMGELPFIKVSDMNLPGNERSIEYSNNWVSFETAKLMKAKPFPESSIVFAKVGAALLLNRRRILSRPTIIDNNMMAAVPSNAADTEFLYQLLMAIDFARFVQEGAVPSINQGDLSSFKLSYPVVEEQQKIAAVLSTADQEISALQQKLETLKQEKKSLMQQLLTGKRRVLVS
ncbi:restriction endonuclease subunit S [bacterium 19MO03SA05]|uniref:Restriction endonuclease subunit S n=1 Tax=bacterium 19MO03SA05 TaxID=2920620 RepID=A0AAU6VC28_UNCXX|nr:restriction endonuclease subunit S [Vibrio metschnikovii]